MHTLTTTRVRVALGALVLGAATVLPALPASSQVVPSPVNITGEAECSTAGPVGRYQIGWTVTNLLPQPQGGNSLGGALVNDVMVLSIQSPSLVSYRWASSFIVNFIRVGLGKPYRVQSRMISGRSISDTKTCPSLK